MVLISLTKRAKRSNIFFFLLGIFALSLFYGEVGGRFFLFGGNPLPDHGNPRWQGSDPGEEQPNRLHHLPTEDIAFPERVAHTGNVSTIQAANTTDFIQMAPTTGRVGLTFNGAARPYVQLAGELFSDFPSVSTEKPVPVTGSKLFLLSLNVINAISGAPIPGLYTSESSGPNLYSGNQKF